MKMRSLLCVLVALILAMSMMLVSCGDDPVETDPVESAPQVNANPESDKQLIANAFPGFSLEGIFDELEGMLPEEGVVTPEFDLDAMMDSLMEAAKSIVVEGDVTITQDGQNLTAYMGIKDGIINMDMMGQDMFIALDKAGISTINPLGGSSFVEFVNIEMPEMPEMPEMSIDEIKALIDEYIPVEVQQIIEGFTFPALSVDDIVLDGDYYVISNEYYKSISDEVLTLVKDIMTEMTPEDAPTQDEFDETVADVDALIDALGIKIGFAVVGQNIVAVRFEVDADVAAIDDMFGGTVDVEQGGEFIPMSVDSAASDKLYAAFEIKLSSDATKLEGVSLDFDACMDGETVTADYDFAISYNGNMPAKINNDMAINVPFENMEFKVSQEYAFSYDGEIVKKIDYTQSISVKNGLDDNIGMNVNASMAPNYDAQGMVTGMDVDATLTVNDIETYQDYCQIAGKDYGASVYTLGDVKVEIAAELDMANVGASNAKIAGLDVNASYTPDSIYYFDDETYEKGTDMSKLVNAPSLSDCTETIEIAFAIMSKGENKCSLTVLATQNGETVADVQGNLTIGSADGMDEAPAIVETIYAEGFAGVYAELEAMGEYMLKNEAYYTYYYDSASGLYVYVTYDSIFIGNVAPDNAELISRYGEFERFGLNG